MLPLHNSSLAILKPPPKRIRGIEPDDTACLPTAPALLSILFGEIAIDLDARQCLRHGAIVKLSRTEWLLLEVLLAGSVLSCAAELRAKAGQAIRLSRTPSIPYWAGMHTNFWNTWDQAALTEYVNECLKTATTDVPAGCNMIR